MVWIEGVQANAIISAVPASTEKAFEGRFAFMVFVEKGNASILKIDNCKQTRV